MRGYYIDKFFMGSWNVVDSDCLLFYNKNNFFATAINFSVVDI